MNATTMFRVVAALIAVDVLAIYSLYMARDGWPPGHPWSAITMGCLVFVFVSFSFTLSGSSNIAKIGRIAGWTAAMLSIVQCVLWTISAFIGREL